MRKIALVLVSMVMACAMMVPLTGCIKTDEQVIRDAVNNELKQIGDTKSDFWQNDLKEATKEFEDLGIDSQGLLIAWIDGYKYEIGAIKIDGNKATVEVTITCKPLLVALNAAGAEMLNDPNFKNITDEYELYSTLMDLAIAQLNSFSPVTTTITIPCTKIGNTWTEDVAAGSEYSRALLGS